MLRDCRKAVVESYREITEAHRWPYLFAEAAITAPPRIFGVTLGAAQFTANSTAFTITPAPAVSLVGYSIRAVPWAVGFSARIVAQTSPGAYTLDAPSFGWGTPSVSPPTTEYELYQDQILLPGDFVEMGEVYAFANGNYRPLEFVRPETWYHVATSWCDPTDYPRHYTVAGDALIPGVLTLKFWPNADWATTVRFGYRRRPRPIGFNVLGANKGTVSIVADSATVQAQGTTTLPPAIGSILRLSADATPPTSDVGSVAGYNPPAYEARIVAVPAPGQLTVDRPCPVALTGVAYTIGAVVDIDQGTMIEALLRCAEKNVSRLRKSKSIDETEAAYQIAIDKARAAASPSYARRYAGDDHHHPGRLSLNCYPLAPNFFTPER